MMELHSALENISPTKEMLSEETHIKRQGYIFPKRYTIAILVFLGMANLFCLRTNLSIAIVEMTKKQKILQENGTYVEIAEFNWDSKVRSFVLSAFSIGYCFSLFGGKVATVFGGASIFGFGIILTAVITLLTPLVVHLNFYLFILCRVIEGILEGFSKASFTEIWSRWAPEKERSKLVACSFTGLFLGNSIAFTIAGLIAKVWGWRAIFYATGGVAFVWYIFWFTLVYNDPSEDKYISEYEKQYIIKRLSYVPSGKVIYPLKSIFTSKPVWAVCSAEFIFGVGFSFAYLCLPQFIKDIENISINEIGYVSSIPHLCGMIAHPLAGFVGDHLRNKKIMTKTQVKAFSGYNLLALTKFVHKLFICGGLSVGAVSFFVIAVWIEFTLAIVTLSIFRFFTSFTEVAMHVVVLDISPAHAGLLSGMATLCTTLAAVFSTTLIGYIVTTQSPSEWSTCFLIISFIYAIGAILFFAFGSARLQPWAYTNRN